MTRRDAADMVIRWGLGFQIVFLLLVDWALIAGFQRADEPPIAHIVALVVLNLALVTGTILLGSWMRRMHQATPLPIAIARVPAARRRR